MNLRSVLRRLVFILTKKTILAILAILVIGIPLLYLTVLNQKTASAWFDESWLYRIPVPISAHTAAESNVYITVTLDTATPITAGKMQSDCGDLRFTKENGEQLPYFINASPGCNNAATTIQVNFDSFPAGAQTIYYYYGNASAPNGFSSAAFSTEAANYTVGTLGSEAQGPGPVGFWSFNDGQGQTTQDSSSSNNDGTLGANSGSSTDDPTWQPEDRCVAEKCLFFDGGDYVNTGLFINTSNNFTLSGWAKVKDKSVHQSFFGVNDNDTNRSYIGLRDGKYWAGVGDTQRYTVTASAITNNTWFHWMLVANGGTAYYYINGIQVDSFAYTGVGLQSTWTNKIGAVQDSSGVRLFTTGFIDEVKVYPYARSAAEIKSDYNSGKANAEAHSGAAAVLGSQTQDFLSNGLVGYWKMDETATPAVDSSGNSKSGTWTSNATSAAGKFGNAISMDGVDDSLSMGDQSIYDFGTNPFTLSAWIYHTSNSDYDFIMGKGGFWGTPEYELYLYNNALNFRVNDGTVNGTASYSTALTGNTWYHVLGSYDGSTVKLYLNGSLVGQAAAAGANITNSYAFMVGYTNSNESFKGLIDEARIYNRALSSAEITSLYNWAPGPVGYWDFEEGGSLGVGSTAADRSGNNNAGVWAGTGAKHSDAGKFGKAGKFNGSDDIVSVDHNSAFNFSGQFSVGAWIYPKAVGSVWRGIVNHRQSADNLGWELKIHNSSNKLVFYDSSTDQSITGDSAILTNQWYYVMATRDSSNVVRMYVNGVLQADSKTYASMSSTSYPLRFGIENNGGTNVFEGQIDEVKIYNYARSQKQIVADMTGGAGSAQIRSVSANNPVAYWKFDEGQGTVANNSGSAGSTLNGTLTSMASPATATSGWTQSGKFGKALNFDGSDDYVNLGTNTIGAKISGATTVALSVWVNYSSLDSGTYDNVVFTSRVGDATNANIWINIRGDVGNVGKVLVGGRSQNADSFQGTTSTTALSANTWYHIVGIEDFTNNKIYIYINGVLDKTTTVTYGSATYVNSGTPTQPDSISSANYVATYPFTGSIDEVKVYNYALTADEVKTDYNKGSSMVLGVAGNNSSYAAGAANQEYCVPGDSTSCAAPVGRWDFEEGKDNTCSGGTNDVCDTSGNGLSGTLTCNGAGCSSKPSWSSGKVGKGIHYSGADQFVRVTDNNLLDLTNNLTLETWVNPSAISADQRIISKTTVNVTWNSYALHLNSDGTVKLILNPTNGAGQTEIATTNTISANTWTHIAATYNGTTAYIYFNGRLVKQQDTSVSVWNSNQDLTIGASPSSGGTTSSQFNGKIDGVRIFNYARTAAQVAYDYNKGAPVGHWKMDECQGNSAKDSSGNNNHGTITIGASGEDTLGTCTTSSTAWGSGATGKRNASLDFDGTDDYVSIPSTAVASGTGTFALWFKSPTSGSSSVDSDLFYCHANSTNRFGLVTNVDNHERLNARIISGGSSVIAASTSTDLTVSANTWHQAVFTTDGSNAKLYIDGKLAQTTATAVTFSSIAPTTCYLGRYSVSSVEYFDGQIDDVKVFNYALTSSQVKNEYNGGAVNFGPSTGAP